MSRVGKYPVEIPPGVQVAIANGMLTAKGRLGELKLAGQVMPNVRKIVYNVDIKRVMRLKLVLGIADGWLSADDEIIYRAKDLRVGLFKQDAAVQPGT